MDVKDPGRQLRNGRDRVPHSIEEHIRRIEIDPDVLHRTEKTNQIVRGFLSSFKKQLESILATDVGHELHAVRELRDGGGTLLVKIAGMEREIGRLELHGKLRRLADQLPVRLPMPVGDDATGLADGDRRRVVLVGEGQHGRRDLPLPRVDQPLDIALRERTLGGTMTGIPLEKRLEREVDMLDAQLFHFIGHSPNGLLKRPGTDGNRIVHICRPPLRRVRRASSHCLFD